MNKSRHPDDLYAQFSMGNKLESTTGKNLEVLGYGE